MIPTKRLVLLLAGLASLAGGMPEISAARAATVANFLKVGGDFRLYDFSKDYGAAAKTDQRSSAAGGVINLSTQPFWGGLGLGMGLDGSWALESFPAGSNTQETTLTGAGPSITTLGQAFVQYSRDGALIRAGRQLIATPWASARDSRMLPQSFEGVSGQVVPAKGWELMAMRLTSFKSRTSSGFYHDNLYYPTGYAGDTEYGVTKAFPKNAVLPDAKGTVAAGVRYAAKGAHAEIWYYDYYDFARSVYGDGGYIFGDRRQAWRPYWTRSS